MTLQEITLYNFRSYEEDSFQFSPSVTMILGENGVGKTNILEAIYMLLQGKSFRDNDLQLLRHNQPWWRIVGVIDEQERELRYEPDKTPPKTLISGGMNRVKYSYRKQLPVVLFEPDDLYMIHGSPSRRREYLDTLLTKLDLTYRATVSRYERALLQRNNVLKRGGSLMHVKDAVFAWDVILSEFGSDIVNRRFSLVESLNTLLSQFYSDIAGRPHDIKIVYNSIPSVSTAKLSALLSAHLEKDCLRGSTGVGPHRDDFGILIDGRNAKERASRGEVRTIVLALKRIECFLIEQATGTVPVFLLDDVFSELDTTRQSMLLGGTVANQTIITSTHAPEGHTEEIITLPQRQS